MAKIPNIIPVTELRQDASGVLKRLREATEPIVITQRGRASAVMLSVESYKRVEHERELLRLLAGGEKEMAAGEGYDLASVLAEADALLAAEER